MKAKPPVGRISMMIFRVAPAFPAGAPLFPANFHNKERAALFILREMQAGVDKSGGGCYFYIMT